MGGTELRGRLAKAQKDTEQAKQKEAATKVKYEEAAQEATNERDIARQEAADWAEMVKAADEMECVWQSQCELLTENLHKGTSEFQTLSEKATISASVES